ncbi:transcriptional regulator [Paraburkholderia bonniea]|uniref:transcriptional regulator n=1 Tax=Paraburkholderia bonniea TaxID=2152891 RepID=UPI0033068795
MDLRTYLAQPHGAASSLGREINVSPVLISQWANRHRRVPAERCPAIEKATGGVVTCEELRPDIDWAYLRGSLMTKEGGRDEALTSPLPRSSTTVE